MKKHAGKPKRSVSWCDISQSRGTPSLSRDVFNPLLPLPSSVDLHGSLDGAGTSADLSTVRPTQINFSDSIPHIGTLYPSSGDDLPHASKGKKKHKFSNSEHNQRLVSFGISLTSTLGDVILVYPCLVLRRQCQVNNVGRKYHYTPFTIVTVAWKLQRSQGITCFWKGIWSNLLLNALTFGVETGISEASAKFPREISSHSKVREVGGHLLMKIFSTALTMPFYSAYLVESIQSEAASETPGIFFCITEGLSRLFGFAGVQSPRMLPFRYLLIPTLFHSLTRYILTSLLQYAIMSAFRLQEKWMHDRVVSMAQSEASVHVDYMSVPSTSTHTERMQYSFSSKVESSIAFAKTQNRELIASFASQLITDLLLYPFECIITRLHVQGTRTIIDNMDRGSGFLPVSSRYEGFMDCVTTIRAQEGTGGLYRGFGALILQHTLKFAVVKLIQVALQISIPCSDP